MALISVGDDRQLDVEVSGPADGVPLVFHHGTPGSVGALRFLERAAAARGLRVVRYSRPGYGDSTRQPGRQVVDAAADTAALLDELGLSRCLVAGWSGGGPHALACGARLAGRVAAVLVIAGVAPYEADGLDWLTGMGEQNIEEFGLAAAGETELRPYLEQAREELTDIQADQLAANLASLLPPVDVDVLTDEFGADLAAQMREALRLGVDGWLDDDLAFVAPWGFALDEVAVPTFLWQGSDDLMVPYAHGQWLATRVPDVAAHLEPGQGHLSITVGAMDRMLDELVTVLPR